MMAPSSVTVQLGAPADGPTFLGVQHRLGMLSRATVAGDGSSNPLAGRSGIIPAAGNPLNVEAFAPATRDVKVKAGVAAVQSADADGGMHSVIVPIDTTLTVPDSNLTQPRRDVVVLKVVADGTAGNTKATVEIVSGTAAASPQRPAVLTSPPPYTSYFVLAEIAVPANSSVVNSGNIGKPGGDGRFTAAPGGVVRNVLRQWEHTRDSTTTFTPGNGGTVNQVSIPAADCLPGIYVANYHVNLLAGGSFGAGAAVCIFDIVTPQYSRRSLFDVMTGRFGSYTKSETIVIPSQPTSTQVFKLDLTVGGAYNVDVGFLDYRSVMQVTRVADF